MKISKLKSNPNNPRIIKDDKFKKLVQSIKEFPEMMDKRPIVCVTDVDDRIYPLGGNMRLKAIQELGYKDIPDNWIMLADEWTEEKRQEFVIKDNVGFGEWDWDDLANNWDTEKLEDWGLDIPDFAVKELEAEEDDYEIPDEIKTDIVIGDLFEIGEHRLLCGDSTDSDQVAKLMNGYKADMVFTDPPYGISVVGKNGSIGKGVKAKEGKYMPIINDDKDYDPSHLFLFDCILFIWGANYFSNKLPKGQWFIWDKGRPEGTTFSDAELAWTNLKGIAIKTFRCVWNGMTREGESGKRVHPTQKPIKLCSDILIDISKENYKIIDLFLGSGSTMVASHQLKRKCYGMELDPKYCQVIIDRMIKLDPSLEIKRNGLPYKQTSE